MDSSTHFPPRASRRWQRQQQRARLRPYQRRSSGSEESGSQAGGGTWSSPVMRSPAAIDMTLGSFRSPARICRNVSLHALHAHCQRLQTAAMPLKAYRVFVPHG